MFVCPLFCEFCKLNKTAKLKCEYRYYTDFHWHYSCAGIVWFEFTKIKGAKIIKHVKSPTFRAAKLKGFTVPLSDTGPCIIYSICAKCGYFFKKFHRGYAFLQATRDNNVDHNSCCKYSPDQQLCHRRQSKVNCALFSFPESQKKIIKDYNHVCYFYRQSVQ